MSRRPRLEVPDVVWAVAIGAVTTVAIFGAILGVVWVGA